MTFMSVPIATPRSLGAQIRQVRTSAGLTQLQVAERAHVSRAFVIDIERGARQRAELDRVFAVLHALGKGLTLIDLDEASFEETLNEILG